MSHRSPEARPGPETEPGPSRRRKVIFIVAGSVVGVLGLVGIAFIVLVVWAYREVDRMEQAEAAGAAYAAQATDTRCLDETLRRVHGSESLIPLSEEGFLRGCLGKAETSLGFCTGVPNVADEDGGIRWREDRCEAAGLGVEHPICNSLFWVVQVHCAGDRSGPGDSAGSP